ncbi:MAG: malto-oligosyltrehalose synthase [Deltaproteobacteria bacterium]|nr:malto-oligosyltrehalose synthase [Deltaproteobacteria bacterium]
MRTPTSTYRLQIDAEHGFDHVRELVPYLDALGVSDVYLAPIFAARPGSEHGYDVVDCGRVSEALGGEAALEALSAALRERGMGLVVDFVPNHMAASLDNPWWREVLTHGRASAHAEIFDIDWEPRWPQAVGRVLVPVLGGQYGEVLERGELRLAWSEAREGFVVRYWEHELPIDPRTLAPLLTEGIEELGGDEAGRHTARVLSVVSRALSELPDRDAPGPGDIATREPQARRALATLAELMRRSERARAHVEALLERFRGTPGDPESFAALDALLGQQAYRLSYWQTAEYEINYRRFFNIADLVGLRQELETVREQTHARLLDLVRDGVVTGLRLDHIDGLRDPRGYLGWLDRRLREVGAGEPWVVVEKILAADEGLPEDWPVAGTTGYDLLNAVNRVMVDPDGLARLDAIYRQFTGRRAAWENIVRAKKRTVMDTLFQADLRSLEWDLATIARKDRHGCDVATHLLGRAIEEVTAALDVYRTYIEDTPPTGADLERIERALALARRRAPGIGAAPFDVLQRVLLLDVSDGLLDQARDFVHRWQQLSSPVMAKGVEDTSLYVYNRLLSLNTVGGEPDLGALTVRELHAFNARRAERWPLSMSTSDTHDAKRGEDVRARLNVLTALPELWGERLRGWYELNAPHRTSLDGEPAPTPNDEMMIYQTLLGVWPADRGPAEAARSLRERVSAYMVKAMREAKEQTSWHDQHEDYEQAVVAFIEGILAEPGGAFIEELADLARRLGRFGAAGSLAALVLKLASPGVPDIYQGGELWALNLVDPDNRRHVDFELRRQMLDALRSAPSPADLAAELLANWEDGRIKLWVTHRGLTHRRAHRDLYLHGDYRPLRPSDDARGRVCAFARHHEGQWLVCAAALRTATWLPDPGEPATSAAWSGQHLQLPEGAPTRWRDVLTDTLVEATPDAGSSTLPLDRLLATLPVALLEPA